MGFISKEDNFKYVEYKCTTPRCNATDRGKYFQGEDVSLEINCWKCGAGRQGHPGLGMSIVNATVGVTN